MHINKLQGLPSVGRDVVINVGVELNVVSSGSKGWRKYMIIYKVCSVARPQ